MCTLYLTLYFPWSLINGKSVGTTWEALCRGLKKLTDADGRTIEGRLYHCINHLTINLIVPEKTIDQCICFVVISTGEKHLEYFTTIRYDITRDKNIALDMINEWRTKLADPRPIGPMKENTRKVKHPKLMTDDEVTIEIERIRMKNNADTDPLLTKNDRTMKMYTNEMIHNVKNIFAHVEPSDKASPAKRHHRGQQNHIYVMMTHIVLTTFVIKRSDTVKMITLEETTTEQHISTIERSSSRQSG